MLEGKNSDKVGFKKCLDFVGTILHMETRDECSGAMVITIAIMTISTNAL